MKLSVILSSVISVLVLSQPAKSMDEVPWDVTSEEDFLTSYFDDISIRALSGGKGFTLDHPYNIFDESMLHTDWMSTYDVVIVVNRAIDGNSQQTLKLYYKGYRYTFTDDYGNLSDTILVSTGRIYNNRSSTPLGYFSPYWLSKNHKQSKTGAPMPFASFFIGNYAIHRVPYEHQEELLGQAVSAGCVRVSKHHVPQIYKFIETAGKGMVAQYTREGKPLRDANGNLKLSEGYKTLVIVQDIVD